MSESDTWAFTSIVLGQMSSALCAIGPKSKLEEQLRGTNDYLVWSSI